MYYLIDYECYLIVGISADAMDIASYKMQDYSSRVSLEKLTIDVADILVKSSGSPEDWEKYGFRNCLRTFKIIWLIVFSLTAAQKFFIFERGPF